MIDQDDGDFFLLLGQGCGFWGFLSCLVIAVILYVVAAQNAEDCSERKCEHGVARLLDHECICTETPK